MILNCANNDIYKLNSIKWQTRKNSARHCWFLCHIILCAENITVENYCVVRITCSLWFSPVLSCRNRGIYWTAGMFFFKIQETFTVSLWEPLKSISCLQFQDILVFEQRAKGASDLWISTFNKQMTVNVHILIAHGGRFSRSAQQEVGFPPKGIYNKLNQVVKEANSSCVARIVLNPST